MTKKSLKKTKEIAPVEVVVKPSVAKADLKRGYAILKERDPESYALKNKDAELERKLKAL